MLMKVSRKINKVRRAILRFLTKDIGMNSTMNTLVLEDKMAIKRVLIARPNGRLGNLLLVTPLVQEVVKTFPNCTIDLFVKGSLAPIIFENYQEVHKAIELPKKPWNNLVDYFKVWIALRKEPYDMAINVDQNSSSGRLAVRFSKAKYKFFGDLGSTAEQVKTDHEHIAKYPVYNFRAYLATLGIAKSNRLVEPLDLKLSPIELAEGKEVLETVVTTPKRTICIFTFATGDKCLSKEWWSFFYEGLVKEFSNYNIIEILPAENVSQIDFQAPSFYSKDIREIGAVIANAELFIGADSGIMHLASSVQTPTIGLFSVSNLEKYAPYDNGSVGVNTDELALYDYYKIIYSILDTSRVRKLPTAYKIKRPVLF